MIYFLISLINILVQLFTLLVVLHVILSYFISPFHPLRQIIARLVEPALYPLRQIIPPVGMLDFSPFVLMVAVQVVGQILISILRSIAY